MVQVRGQDDSAPIEPIIRHDTDTGPISNSFPDPAVCVVPFLFHFIYSLSEKYKNQHSHRYQGTGRYRKLHQHFPALIAGCQIYKQQKRNRQLRRQYSPHIHPVFFFSLKQQDNGKRKRRKRYRHHAYRPVASKQHVNPVNPAERIGTEKKEYRTRNHILPVV